MAIDVPHIWLYLAELITPMLHEGGIPMGQLFRWVPLAGFRPLNCLTTNSHCASAANSQVIAEPLCVIDIISMTDIYLQEDVLTPK